MLEKTGYKLTVGAAASPDNPGKYVGIVKVHRRPPHPLEDTQWVAGTGQVFDTRYRATSYAREQITKDADRYIDLHVNQCQSNINEKTSHGRLPAVVRLG